MDGNIARLTILDEERTQGKSCGDMGWMNKGEDQEK